MKINVGCGESCNDGYVPIDKIYGQEIMEIDFPVGSVDEIYCSHMLEHLDKCDAEILMSRFHKWLKVNGTLFLAVPDLEAIAELILIGEEKTRLFGMLFGTPYREYRHKWGWTRSTLIELANESGFSYVKDFEPFMKSNEEMLKVFYTNGFDTSAAIYIDRGEHIYKLSLNMEFSNDKDSRTFDKCKIV